MFILKSFVLYVLIATAVVAFSFSGYGAWIIIYSLTSENLQAMPSYLLPAIGVTGFVLLSFFAYG